MQRRNKAVKAFEPVFKEELMDQLDRHNKSLEDFPEFDKFKGGMKEEYK